MPHGQGIFKTEVGDIFEGECKNGELMAGTTKIMYAKGEYYEGNVVDGKRQGQGAHWYSNGDRFEGDWVNNMRVGKGSLKFLQGGEYIGQFIDDQADGHGLYTDEFGNRYESQIHENKKDSGYFLKGRLYGKGEIKFKNGDSYQGEFKDGL